MARSSTSRLSRCLSSILLLTTAPFAYAKYDLDVNSTSSIKTITKQLTKDMLTFYHGDEPGMEPGLLPQPYYWWAAGAMMGTLIDYWYYTGDDSYVNLTMEGLLAQVGEYDDYMPKAQVMNEGNDDQGFWGLAVMAAAEYNFPNPPADRPQWLGLAQAVFNTQASRWDKDHCGGGLRWQVFNWNKGFDYKNSISNGCFFAIAARLALYTGNQSYADWADKTWDWMVGVDLIDKRGNVYDGAHISDNCTERTPYQFSYNVGVFINGVSAMYNMTEEQKWKDRLDMLLGGSKVFFTGPEKNIMTEVACEPVNQCNLDQQSFKAYLSRWLSACTKWAPYTYDFIMPYLRASAEAAIAECTGGNNGRMCGLHWTNATWDGSTGVGQQMAAIEVTLACMIKDRAAPKTAKDGGTSKSNPGQGGSDIGRTTPELIVWAPLSTADVAGAAILTIVIVGSFLAGIVFLFVDEVSDKSVMQQLKGIPQSTMAVFAGGAAGAAVLHKRDSQINEKGQARAVVSEGSSQLSSDGAVEQIVPAPLGHTRSMSEPHPDQRRLSNMPRGWPHNPSLRASTLYDNSPSRPASFQAPPARSAEAMSTHSAGSGRPGPAISSHGVQEPQQIRRKSLTKHQRARSVNH